jgi:hypothetical protein
VLLRNHKLTLCITEAQVIKNSKVPTSERYKGFIIFAVITVLCIFLSDNNLLEEFSSRLTYLRSNWRLIGLIGIADFLFLVSFSCLTVFFFKLYRVHIRRQTTYRNVFWHIGSIYMMLALSSLLRIIGIWYMYMWIYAIFILIAATFAFLVMIEFFKFYKDLSSPLLPDSKKELIDLIKERFEKIEKILNE